MFNFFRKYRLIFKILTVLVFALATYDHLQEYVTEVFETAKEKKVKLLFVIVLVLMTIVQFVDLIEILKSRKKKITE